MISLKELEKNYVGILRVSDKFSFVETQRNKMYIDIFIKNEDISGETGDLVLVELLGWDVKSKSPQGKVINVIGKPGSNDSEIHAIFSRLWLTSIIS